MMKVLRLVGLIGFFAGLAWPKNEALDKLTIGASFNYAALNDTFLQGLGGLKKSPDWMTGIGFAGKVHYQIKKRFGVFALYESASLSGNGPWELSQTDPRQKAAGVTGQALGKVDMRPYAFGLGPTFLFWSNNNNQLRLEADVVRVQRISTFVGEFHGFDGVDYFTVPDVTDYDHTVEWRPEARLLYQRKIAGPFSMEFSGGVSAIAPELRVGFSMNTSVIPRLPKLLGIK